MEIHVSKVIDWATENSSVAPDLDIQRAKMRVLVTDALQTSIEAGAKLSPSVNVETYVACKILLQQLEAAEGSQAKNMFGQYALPHMQNWANVLSKWEEKNLHVADSQDFLFRSLFFQYPHLKRSIVTTEKSVVDITRRVHENDRNLHSFTKKVEDLLVEWDLEAKEMSMTSTDIATNLLAHCDQFSEFNTKIVDAIRDDTIRAAMEFYIAFVHAQSNSTADRLSALQRLQLTPLPTHTTPPTKSSSPSSSIDGEWTAISAAEARRTPSPLTPESSLHILTDKVFREQLTADMYELRAFLCGRIAAMQDTLSVAGEESIVSCSVTVTTEQLRAAVEAIENAMGLVCDSKMGKLYLLAESDDLVKRISVQIESAMRKVQVVKNLRESSLHRQKELEANLEDLVKQKNALKQLMRETKADLEKVLSKLAGKEIRIVSENMPAF